MTSAADEANRQSPPRVATWSLLPWPSRQLSRPSVFAASLLRRRGQWGGACFGLAYWPECAAWGSCRCSLGGVPLQFAAPIVLHCTWNRSGRNVSRHACRDALACVARCGSSKARRLHVDLCLVSAPVPIPCRAYGGRTSLMVSTGVRACMHDAGRCSTSTRKVADLAAACHLLSLHTVVVRDVSVCIDWLSPVVTGRV